MLRSERVGVGAAASVVVVKGRAQQLRAASSAVVETAMGGVGKR